MKNKSAKDSAMAAQMMKPSSPHYPPKVAARKKRRWHQWIGQFSPSKTGSAKHQRRQRKLRNNTRFRKAIKQKVEEYK